MDLKQVIVIRKDLGMRKGKMVAQGAHASRGACRNHTDEQTIFNWELSGETKIVVGVENEKELLALYRSVNKDGLSSYLVHDNGNTEVEAGTKTALAVGPYESDKIDEYTGDLKLL